MEQQFVIHIHSGYGPVHYDLMLQHGETLATWQLSQSPAELTSDEKIAAKKLQDHHIAYLSYEGPVSKDRGQVTVLDKGTYKFLSADDRHWEIEMNGKLLKGRFVIEQSGQAPEEWAFRHRAKD